MCDECRAKAEEGGCIPEAGLHDLSARERGFGLTWRCVRFVGRRFIETALKGGPASGAERGEKGQQDDQAAWQSESSGDFIQERRWRGEGGDSGEDEQEKGANDGVDVDFWCTPKPLRPSRVSNRATGAV